MSGSIFKLPPYAERKNPSELLLDFADGGNRTQAACAANEYAIHYSIASRLPDNPERKVCFSNCWHFLSSVATQERLLPSFEIKRQKSLAMVAVSQRQPQIT